MKKSNDKGTGAEEAIEAINAIETVEELAAFVPDSEARKTVLAAFDQRYADLTEGAKAPTEDETEASAESEAPSTAEAESEEEAEEAAPGEGDVETDEVPADVHAELVEIVQAKVDADKAIRGNAEPDTTAVVLADALKEFAKGKTEDSFVVVPVSAIDGLVSAVKDQATLDATRRGMSQPTKVDARFANLALVVFAEKTEN